MIEVCFTEEEFRIVNMILKEGEWQSFPKEIMEGIIHSLETASKPMLYTSENKQRIKE